MTFDQILDSEVWRFRQVWQPLRLDHEDLVQDVWVEVLRRPIVGDGGAHQRLGIRQRLIEVLRRKGWRARQARYTGAKGAVLNMPLWSDLTLTDPTHTPVPPDPWQTERLHRALHALPERQARVVWRHVVEGDELTAIAKDFNRSLSWAWQQKTRGLARLKQELTCQ